MWADIRSQEDTHPILVFMHILDRVPNRGVTGCSGQAEYSPRVIRLMENWRWRNGGCWCLAGKGERLFRWGIIDAFNPKRGGLISDLVSNVALEDFLHCLN
jgi:hypothetical protein